MVRPVIGVIALLTLPLLFAAPQAAAAQTSCTPALVDTKPTLTQDAPRSASWHTTVYVTGTCGKQQLDFALELTTSPGSAIDAPTETTATPVDQGEVTVTFDGIPTVPTSAALVMNSVQSGVVQLSVSRAVGWWYYLGLPAAAGGGLAFLLLLALLFIPVYTYDSRRRRDRNLRVWRPDFWRRRLVASGGWTASDSWATNIGTVVSISTGFGALNASAAAFLPGVATDRFGILLFAAGIFVAAAPMVFAVQYARWTAKMPALTADAVVRPTGAPPFDVPGTTQLAFLNTAHAELRADTVVTLAELSWDGRHTPFGLSKPTCVELSRGVTGMLSLLDLPGDRHAILCSGTVTLPQGTTFDLADRSTAKLIGHTGVTITNAVVLLDSTVRLAAPLPDTEGLFVGGALGDLRYESGTQLRAPSGASLTGSAAMTVVHRCGAGAQTTQVGANQTVQLPPDSDALIVAERVTMPGGADLVTQGATLISVDNAGHDGAIVLSGSGGAPDQVLSFPVLCWVPSGCKITATDLATVTLPDGAQVETPGRESQSVEAAKQRPLVLAAGNSNQLVGTMRMVIISAMVTMFGIGAEIGLMISVLKVSTATTSLMWVMGAGIAAIVLFLLYYSATAIRSLADPQPGSSLSSAVGTSFTL